MSAKSRPRKRRWRRLLVWILLSLVILWALANLFFATPLGTGLVSRFVEARTGLACVICRISWTPWSGVTVVDVTLSSPADFSPTCQVAHIPRVEVDPLWTGFFQRKKRFEKVVIEASEIELPIELIRFLGRKRRAEPIPQYTPGTGLAVPQSSPSAEEQPKLTTPIEPAPQEPAQDSQPGQPIVVEEPSEGAGGEFVLHPSRLRLYSLHQPGLDLSLNEVAAKLPVWGEPRDGALSFGAALSGEEIIWEGAEMTPRWERGFLSLNEPSQIIAGVTVDLQAAARPVPGLPYGLTVKIPDQALALTGVGGEELDLTFEHLTGRAQLEGFALRPTLFVAGMEWHARKMTVTSGSELTEAEFSWGFAQVQASAAGLVVPDFRIVGEEEAILGNGWVQANGEGAALLRLVASPVRVNEYARYVSRKFDGFALQPKPLVTPDRYFSDVRFDLSSGVLAYGIEPAETAPVIP